MWKIPFLPVWFGVTVCFAYGDYYGGYGSDGKLRQYAARRGLTFYYSLGEPKPYDGDSD